MNIHYLQHAATEGPGHIATWATEHGHTLSSTHWYRGDKAPDPVTIDFLAIMGGGMNIYQHRDHPWLITEKKLIADVIERKKPVLGVCLGAQLLADILGGKVYQNPFYEIGWYPVRMLDNARKHPLFQRWPEEFTALHWHGDTYSLPPGAEVIALSEGCSNQAFVCPGNIVGLQFHVEVRPEDVRAFISGETEPLPAGKYVQSFEEIMAGDRHTPAVHQLLNDMLDAMVE